MVFVPNPATASLLLTLAGGCPHDCDDRYVAVNPRAYKFNPSTFTLCLVRAAIDVTEAIIFWH